MKQLLLVGLLCSSLAFGYATNREGSVLYFSSPLRMKGTAQHYYPKIFVWEAGKGVRLFLQRERELPVVPESGFACGVPYLLDDIDVSADGFTIALTTRKNCAGVLPNGTEPLQTEFWKDGTRGTALSGTASMSRNGRYALTWGSESPNWPSGLNRVQVADLTTGQLTSYDAWKEGSITNDGTALLTISGFLALARGGRTTPLGLMGTGARISESGDRIVYNTPTSAFTSSQLFSWSAATGRSTLLNQVGAKFVMSDDASVVAFNDAYPFGNLIVMNGDGSSRRQLAFLPDTSSPVAMSGDGKVLFVNSMNAITGGSRILRVDLASGQYTEVIPAMPRTFRSILEYLAAPGVLFTDSWGGLGGTPMEAHPPFPTTLGGITVRVNGTPVPVSSVTAEGVRYQVPWDLPDGESVVEIEGPYFADSIFVAGGFISADDANFYTRSDNSTRRAMYGDNIIVAAHQDFDRLVADADPARGGEVIHLFAQALGPVTPAFPAMGEIAPATPLLMLRQQIVCRLSDYSFELPLEVQFAGLAPGMMGVYQLDLKIPLKIPPSAAEGWSSINCGIAGPSGAFGAPLLKGYLTVASLAN